MADWKVKPTVQVAPAASVAGQTLVASAVMSAPLSAQLRPVTAVVAETVTAPVALALTRTWPRSTLSVTMKDPGATPVPVRVTETPVVVTMSVPLAGPTAVGVKLKLIVQVPAAVPAAPSVPQVVPVIANGPVADGLSEVATPRFVTVMTVGVELDAPLTTLPKSADGGLTFTATVPVVPPPPPSTVGAASGVVVVLSLPPQPAPASMPTSPRQLA